MSPLAMALVGATILVTSFISGIFGIAGGMILLGVLLVFFDVATGMVIFSIIQFFGNIWRVILWWRFIIWPIFFSYLIGAAIAFGLLRFVAFVPDKATVYLLLGLMPFAIELLPHAARPNIEWRGVPLMTGVTTTFIQLLAGPGGVFLDLFFQKSSLDRKTTIATKTTAQTTGHVLRLLYFGTLSGAGDALPLWAYGAAIALAIGGNSLAPLVLERMTDHGFRQWTRALIFAVSTVYLIRAAWLFLNG
jgi:uncharacterized membrane protein YfcA